MDDKQTPTLIQQHATWHLHGDLTFETVSKLEHALNVNDRPLQIDLSKVGHVDSAGLALLVSWVNFAKKQQKSINFVKIPAKVNAMIQMRGLRGILYANRTS